MKLNNRLFTKYIMNKFSEEDLISLIQNNLYVSKCTSNQKKDVNSLSYLIRRKLSQSDCIKLGIAVETVLRDLILKAQKNFVDIRKKNIKGKKEKDHLFLDVENKTIYYAELKANIVLDTEKSKATYQKCLKIVEEIKKDYPDHEIKWCLLAYRFLNFKEISQPIQKKYIPIKDNLFGINEYFSMLKIEHTFTQEKYIEFLNNIVEKMFSNS